MLELLKYSFPNWNLVEVLVEKRTFSSLADDSHSKLPSQQQIIYALIHNYVIRDYNVKGGLLPFP